MTKKTKEPTSEHYNVQRDFFKNLWTELTDNYQGGPAMPSVINAIDLDKMKSFLDIDGTESYAIKYFYPQLLNFRGAGYSIENPNFLSLAITAFTALLKERNIIKYSPECEGLIQNLYKKTTLYRKKDMIPVSIDIGDDFRTLISSVLPDLVQQEEIKRIQTYLSKPRTLFEREQIKAEEIVQSIDTRLSEQQNKIDELENQLKDQHKELNFVGLSYAFSHMRKAKSEARNLLMWCLGICFVIILSVPVFVLIALFCGVEPTWYRCIPFATIEILLIYLFRLFYQQYLALRSEILQLDLRCNLCTFIEGYMEFKAKHNDETVRLFEKLIFSNIISDGKKVPGTFDGVDSIARLLSELKKTSG